MTLAATRRGTDTAGLDSPRAWLVVAATFVATFTVFGVAYSFGAFFEPMADEFDAGRSAISAVFSITAGLYFFLGTITGPAVDRVGPRPVLLTGAVAMGAGLGLTSIVDRLWLGYITYGVGVGIGVACGYVPMLAVVGGWFSRRRSVALGIAVAGIGVGTLGVSPLAAALIDAHGWRMAYRVFAVASAVLLTGCALASSPPPRPTATASFGTPSALRSPAFLVLYVSMLMVSVALFMVFIFLVPFAEEHGVGKVAAATLMGIVGASSIVGRLLLGALADRMGALRTYRACFLVIALTYVLWLTTTTYPWLLTFSITYGIVYGGFIALSPAVMADVFGSATMGRLIGVLYTSAGVGAVAGAPLAGLVIDRTGTYRWTIGLAAVLALAGWLLLSRLSDHVATHRAGTTGADVPLHA